MAGNATCHLKIYHVPDVPVSGPLPALPVAGSAALTEFHEDSRVHSRAPKRCPRNRWWSAGRATPTFMSSNLKDEIARMRIHLSSDAERLAPGIVKAVRRACEHTAHDVVVNGEPARTRALHESGLLGTVKNSVAIIVADMEREAQGTLAWPDFWPHRNNGDIAVFASSVPGSSEVDPQPPKRFVDALGTPAVQRLKKLFDFYGYAFTRTLLRWPRFPTDELSAYIQKVRKLRDLQQALAAQEATPSGTQSAEELWLKA